jgi:hypothetical protein
MVPEISQQPNDVLQTGVNAMRPEFENVVTQAIVK